jgi:hypothetical protein
MTAENTLANTSPATSPVATVGPAAVPAPPSWPWLRGACGAGRRHGQALARAFLILARPPTLSANKRQADLTSGQPDEMLMS